MTDPIFNTWSDKPVARKGDRFVECDCGCDFIRPMSRLQRFIRWLFRIK